MIDSGEGEVRGVAGLRVHVGAVTWGDALKEHCSSVTVDGIEQGGSEARPHSLQDLANCLGERDEGKKNKGEE